MLQPQRGRQFFARMDTSPIAIFCIRLKSFPLLGNPASVAFRYLQALFPPPSRGVIFHDLVLGIETLSGLETFKENLRKLIKELEW